MRRDAGDNAAIREWAMANGRTVSEREQIPQQVQDAYVVATG